MRIDQMNQEYEYDNEEGEIEYYAERPNKTRIKKEMAALFDLGEELSKLSPAQLSSFELPDIVHNSVTQASGMPHKGARKRLLKYIAGQLHKLDIEPIREQLARIQNKSAHGIREHHMAERWRDHLLSDGNQALTDLLYEQPGADGQKIRQWVRNAKKETESLKPPKSSRMLYRYLKELFGSENPDGLDAGEEAGNEEG